MNARTSNSLFATNLTSSDSFLSVNESLLPYRAAKNSSTCFKSGNSNFDVKSGMASANNCKSTRTKRKISLIMIHCILIKVIMSTKQLIYSNVSHWIVPDLVKFGNRLSKMAGGCVANAGGSSSSPLNNTFKKC